MNDLTLNFKTAKANISGVGTTGIHVRNKNWTWGDRFKYMLGVNNFTEACRLIADKPSKSLVYSSPGVERGAELVNHIWTAVGKSFFFLYGGVDKALTLSHIWSKPEQDGIRAFSHLVYDVAGVFASAGLSVGYYVLSYGFSAAMSVTETTLNAAWYSPVTATVGAVYGMPLYYQAWNDCKERKLVHVKYNGEVSLNLPAVKNISKATGALIGAHIVNSYLWG